MEEYLIMFVRTIFLYFTIILIFRLMGKREIGELSILDLVVFIMIAEIAAIGIERAEEPLFKTIFPMFIMLGIQVGLAYLSLKSQKIRDLLDGRPSVIINKGKIDEYVMKKQRYNFDDLMMQLREKNINRVSDVEFAILETSGKLSVIQKDQSQDQSLNLPLILDGVIKEEHLTLIKKNELWLRQELKKLGYGNVKNISYCSYQNGTFYVDEKDEKK